MCIYIYIVYIYIHMHEFIHSYYIFIIPLLVFLQLSACYQRRFATTIPLLPSSIYPKHGVISHLRILFDTKLSKFLHVVTVATPWLPHDHDISRASSWPRCQELDIFYLGARRPSSLERLQLRPCFEIFR